MTRRSPIAVFLLPFVTFGFYALFWIVRTKTEMNSRGAGIPTAWLLLIPIVNIYWLYRFAQGVDHVTGGRMSTAAAFLLTLFLGTIGYAVIQSSLNDVAN
ncbi:MAG: DUF4234 domain-containing protein [Candidatus Atribacteria bacterium]|jgi:apolipoprotein N-acyltransferase|nr:MAG: DUF4234 domain-containing protein [Candidatus Atribacteria bacterium]